LRSAAIEKAPDFALSTTTGDVESASVATAPTPDVKLSDGKSLRDVLLNTLVFASFIFEQLLAITLFMLMITIIECKDKRKLSCERYKFIHL
jgi:hypothetical protein